MTLKNGFSLNIVTILCATEEQKKIQMFQFKNDLTRQTLEHLWNVINLCPVKNELSYFKILNLSILSIVKESPYNCHKKSSL